MVAVRAALAFLLLLLVPGPDAASVPPAQAAQSQGGGQPAAGVGASHGLGRSGRRLPPGIPQNGKLPPGLFQARPRQAPAGGGAGGADVHWLGFNEPTIAVSPANPNHLAIADLGLLRVSTDGGVSFEPPFVIQVPFADYTPSGDPSLTYDSQGRLFWSYLGRRRDNALADVFISQFDPVTGAILPGYPVNLSAAAGLPALLDNDSDKEWIAADRFVASPFRDRLYAVWTLFGFDTEIYVSHSDDQGLSWSPASKLSTAAEGFVWPVHIAVAPDGAVYVAYHSQPGLFTGAPDGISGQVLVLRSDDGGATFPSKTLAYAPGEADVTFNEQFLPRTLDGNVSWTQGSAQAWVLPDPVRPDHVYVVAADDPTNTVHGAGVDDMDVFLVRSTDRGASWGAPLQVDSAPAGTLQMFPTAGIADRTGCLGIAWWDARAGATNGAGNFLLDFYVRASPDGGASFDAEILVNDLPFDPDLGAVDRYPPSGTLRIGEYNGVALVEGTAHTVWTGNSLTGQLGLFDTNVACTMPCQNGVDDDMDGFVDFPDDAGCRSPTDPSEEPDCSDGLDGDSDLLLDFPDDDGCRSASDPSEEPDCDDGLDNDGDGGVDWDGVDLDGDGGFGGPGESPPDAQCNGNANKKKETPRTCGLGFELALALACLGRLARRTRRSGAPS